MRSFGDERADATILGPVRAALGALLAWHAGVAAAALGAGGFFGDRFHVSLLPVTPSARAYTLGVAVRLFLGVTAALGIWARPSLALGALLGIVHLLGDANPFPQDRYSLFCFAFLLALTPCDRAFRVGGPPVPLPRSGPFWAARLAAVQVSIVHLASGGAKLLDADWRDGLVLADHASRGAVGAAGHVVPHAVLAWLARPDAASALAKLTITTELVLAVALWLGPTRVPALWWGTWFELVLFATTPVGTLPLVLLAAHGLFATPDRAARTLRYDPSRVVGKLLRVAVPLLDWFGRFAVKPWEPDDRRGHGVVVIRRDGERATGIRAAVMLARCLPLLFPIWAPLALVASFTPRGDLSARA